MLNESSKQSSEYESIRVPLIPSQSRSLQKARNNDRSVLYDSFVYTMRAFHPLIIQQPDT